MSKMNTEYAIALSRHRDGFNREAALRYLQQWPCAIALSLVLERMNDHVPEIRDLALQICWSYIDAGKVADILACTKQWMALRQKTRLSHERVLNAIADLLAEPQNRTDLLDAFHAGRGPAARHLLAWVMGKEGNSKGLCEGLSHSDFTVRLCSLAAIPHTSVDAVLELVISALRDESSAVQKQALILVMKSHADDEQKRIWLLPLLFSASRGVREMTRWYLGQLSVDVRLQYRNALDQGVFTATKLESLLCEADRDGITEALPLARLHVGHSRARIRKAALQLLIKHAPAEQEVLLKLVWRDASLKLKRYFAEQIGTHILVTAEAGYEMAMAAWQRDEDGLAWSLTRKLGLWRSVGLMLELAQDGRKQAKALDMLRCWDTPTGGLKYANPYEAEREFIRRLLGKPEVLALVNTMPYLSRDLQHLKMWPE